MTMKRLEGGRGDICKLLAFANCGKKFKNGLKRLDNVLVAIYNGKC